MNLNVEFIRWNPAQATFQRVCESRCDCRPAVGAFELPFSNMNFWVLIVRFIFCYFGNAVDAREIRLTGCAFARFQLLNRLDAGSAGELRPEGGAAEWLGDVGCRNARG